jgi:hypothetical protein
LRRQTGFIALTNQLAVAANGTAAERHRINTFALRAH